MGRHPHDEERRAAARSVNTTVGAAGGRGPQHQLGRVARAEELWRKKELFEGTTGRAAVAVTWVALTTHHAPAPTAAAAAAGGVP